MNSSIMLHNGSLPLLILLCLNHCLAVSLGKLGIAPTTTTKWCKDDVVGLSDVLAQIENVHVVVVPGLAVAFERSRERSILVVPVVSNTTLSAVKLPSGATALLGVTTGARAAF